MFSFKVSKDWPSDHKFILQELSGNSLNVKESVKQIDLHGKPGWCQVTLSSRAQRETVLSKGLCIRGEQLELHLPDEGSTQLHVFGCPVGMPDGPLSASLSVFGKLIGPPSHGKISFEGTSFKTGIRYVNIVLSKPVPSCVTVGKRKLRVWHRGQTQTCWRCGTTGHEARECKVRAGREPESSSRTNSNSSSEPSDSVPQLTCERGSTRMNCVGSNSEVNSNTSQHGDSVSSIPTTRTKAQQPTSTLSMASATAGPSTEDVIQVPEAVTVRASEHHDTAVPVPPAAGHVTEPGGKGDNTTPRKPFVAASSNDHVQHNNSLASNTNAVHVTGTEAVVTSTPAPGSSVPTPVQDWHVAGGKCSTFSPIILQQTASAFPSVANRFSALEHSMERKRKRGARSDASSSADLSAKAVCPTTKTDDFYGTGSDWEEECEGDDGRGRSRHEVVQ